MSDLTQLARAMDAAYQARLAALKDVTAEEAALRRQLADLDAMRLGARALPEDQLAAPRAIGADMLWQGWTQRTRQDLNMKLAQVLVRKAERMTALRQAFGRAEAAAQLLQNEKAVRRKGAQDRDQVTRQHLALMRGATSSGG